MFPKTVLPRSLLIPSLIIACMSCGLNAPAFGKTWYISVDGKGDAPTIQAGIDSCANGDVVLVGPGTYADTIHVDVLGTSRAVNAHITKNVVLRSEFGSSVTTIDGTKSDICFLLDGLAGSAEVRGFEFLFIAQPGGGCVTAQTQLPALSRRLSSPPVGNVGIWCISSSCVIAENTIHDAEADTGIYLYKSSALIASNTMTAVGCGVNAEGESTPSIERNTFTNCGVAVTTLDTSPTICRNTIRHTGAFACYGIECLSTDGGPATPLISENLIEQVENEAIFCAQVAPIITGNTVRKTSGVSVLYCGETAFTGNFLIENAHGLTWQGTPNGVVQGNTFDSNGSAVQLYQGSNPRVSGNIVFGGGLGFTCFYFVSPAFSCNDVYGTAGDPYAGECPDQTGTNGNFSADPQFCGITGSGNYQLQSDSPCVPGNHPAGTDCGLIGASPSACSTVPVKTVTWGRVKAIYK